MIGVLGGSFDPIHFGHINPLIEVSEQFNLSEIKLIPTYQSAVGKVFHANSEHRMNMVSIIAASSSNNFVAEDLELRRGGVSYTYDTIKLLKERHKNDRFCLIMGLDVFLKIESWYNYKKILNEVNILVMSRPGFSLKKLDSMDTLIHNKISKNKVDFIKNNNNVIYFHETAPINISSSLIRDKISKGEDPIKKIPGSIMSYIRRNDLYKKYE